MNEKIAIREAYITDAGEVYELLCIIATLHRNGRPDVFNGLVSKYNIEQLKERFAKKDSGVFVAECNCRVVGYVFCDIHQEGECRSLYVDDLCVNPNMRRMGIGKMLMDKAKEYGKIKECNFLTLNVWEFNASALDFYENYGLKTRNRQMEIEL